MILYWIFMSCQNLTFEYNLKLLKFWQDTENELLIGCADIETKKGSVIFTE